MLRFAIKTTTKAEMDAVLQRINDHGIVVDRHSATEVDIDPNSDPDLEEIIEILDTLESSGVRYKLF